MKRGVIWQWVNRWKWFWTKKFWTCTDSPDELSNAMINGIASKKFCPCRRERWKWCLWFTPYRMYKTWDLITCIWTCASSVRVCGSACTCCPRALKVPRVAMKRGRVNIPMILNLSDFDMWVYCWRIGLWLIGEISVLLVEHDISEPWKVGESSTETQLPHGGVNFSISPVQEILIALMLDSQYPAVAVQPALAKK